jgi:hypothetical protein
MVALQGQLAVVFVNVPGAEHLLFFISNWGGGKRLKGLGKQMEGGDLHFLARALKQLAVLILWCTTLSAGLTPYTGLLTLTSYYSSFQLIS